MRVDGGGGGGGMGSGKGGGTGGQGALPPPPISNTQKVHCFLSENALFLLSEKNPFF